MSPFKSTVMRLNDIIDYLYLVKRNLGLKRSLLKKYNFVDTYD